MPSDDDFSGHARRGVAIVAVAMVLAACSKSTSPSLPTTGSSSLAGTWSGTITSPIIADGRVTIVLAVQPAPAALPPSFQGTFEMVFADAAFSARGAVYAFIDPTNSRTIVMTFDSAPVPCPGEAGGVREIRRTAVLTLTGRRANGGYIATPCPGGTLMLERQ